MTDVWSDRAGLYVESDAHREGDDLELAALASGHHVAKGKELEALSTELARARITDPAAVSSRLDGVQIPVLVLGRDQDELQAEIRRSFDWGSTV